ncbi:MAG TPA: twin-arginine translocase TatA/TatE family subunit [Actinomycetota bacterium]|nr:twin-arginine translocase TatA/TatE family subunit [Actinomycetota bacterium]
MLAVSLGPTEILIIVALIALLFGAKRIPELARSLGRSQSEFKRGIKEGGTTEDEPPREASPPSQGDAPAEKQD